MLRLHGEVKSRALRPLWLLEELGIPFEWVPTAPRSEGARAVSPLGKIPVLVTEEGPVFDSVAQMTFLADRAGRFTHPAGSYLRARQDALTNTINETFDAVLWAYAKHSFVLPEEHRVPAVKDSLRWQFGRYAEVMADLIEGPFLMGAEPLVPDFLLAHCCGWAEGLRFDLPEGLRTHMTAMRARPAFQRAIAHG
ncbi:glutathione S-transferase family protein [Jannaschia seohaensis]|uniref:Glutathione S-transferase n=1 Tax=Jannaschia seohaensis TaxID=475081 RepID=A0A2Y9AYH0_9RHOB|nr:glutathione S-transferase [Jannaschia seohaensis]PWJ16246.1 glutathione S-transferase [Jannaschia seohaensis]SSA49320.1 glutathione S-transferase [Jannaschia seohaensis]